ncbi:MAG: Gfo/Idh/MocA family oxidoreductase, partial [Acidimicrobiales bacterium]|nr:Gfo/Idh/MocA family oxidoreductase [Acidimicrobiales bacterium]
CSSSGKSMESSGRWNAGLMRWGVVGHGRIVSKFLDAARGVGHEVVAVTGRETSRAAVFATHHGIGWAGGNPADLVGEVDAVYVATPHSSHRDVALVLLGAGVPVLCEKPMAVNALQVRQMVAVARSSGTFLMEAMWTRHLPVFRVFRRWIDEGRLGEIEMVEARFGFSVPYDPTNRLWAPGLAGGSLLDVGIYPLTLAELAFGTQPVSFDAEAELSPDGVDACLCVVADYSAGGSARLTSAINADFAPNGRIIGTKGIIEVPNFWCAERMALTSLRGEKVDEVHEPHQVNGFEYQIIEAARCLKVGAAESPVVPWVWSVAMAELMDEIRSRIGVVYPCDRESL